MRVTDWVKVHGPYRLLRKAISVQASIHRRQDWAARHGLLKPVHEIRMRRVLRELETFTSRLDSNEFISHTPVSVLNPVKVTLDYIFEGVPGPSAANHDDVEMAFIENMNMKGRRKRAGEHTFALCCELADKTDRGWYLVFNTLTVDPGNYAAVFVDGGAFSDYVRRVSRAVAAAAHGSIRAAKGHDSHTYFAAVEEGKLKGRLHIHVLHFCSALPAGSKDPNKGLPQARKREIDAWRKFWPHGLSSPIAVRYSHADAYGRAGWRWPLDKKTGKGLKTGSAVRVAGYVAKYVSKSYLSQKRSELLWRVRKSQKLGRLMMDRLVAPLTLPELSAVASDPSIKAMLNNQQVPPEMLRLAALRRLAHLSTGSLLGILRELSPLPSPLLSLRGSIQTLRSMSSSPPNIGVSQALLYDGEDTSRAAQDALWRSADDLDQRYFRRTSHPFVASTR